PPGVGAVRAGAGHGDDPALEALVEPRRSARPRPGADDDVPGLRRGVEGVPGHLPGAAERPRPGTPGHVPGGPDTLRDGADARVGERVEGNVAEEPDSPLRPDVQLPG